VQSLPRGIRCPVHAIGRPGCGHVTSRARSDHHTSDNAAIWHARFAETVRLLIAPLLLLASGFFTADFLLSGVYTWPRTSRVVALTLTILVLSYEFIYKEQRIQFPERPGEDRLKILLYSCVIPYAVGAVALLVLAHLAS
jgi:hypothetical protein